MAKLEEQPKAWGGPGIEPRWTHSAKDAVGTAYSTSSRVWFTVSNGVVSEVYYPSIDRPQVRDLQLLITDGETFFHDAHRHLECRVEYFEAGGLGIRMVNADRQGRYRVVMEILADAHQACLLLDGAVEGDAELVERLKVYVLLAPHLDVGGWGNTGNLAQAAGRRFLTAHKNGIWLALGASVPLLRCSCGFVGRNDGWLDLSDNFRMDYEFAAAENGNIALTAELGLGRERRFTLGLGFGHSLHRAIGVVLHSLNTAVAEHRGRFAAQWERARRHFLPLERQSGDGGRLYRRSCELLLAHEDKGFSGALIASMSIPWGEVKGDEDLGGYHLVWTRDLVQSATGLIAGGDLATAVAGLIYLASTQQSDGGFAQNFWLDGTPYWHGVQLDEVAFPLILAWRLERARALGAFDPYPTALLGARYMILNGPVTPQDRWEENSGFSPATLAAVIAGLICVAGLARKRGDPLTAAFLEEYADFLENHLERWTVTSQGTLVPGIRRHYVRINPASADDPYPDEDPDSGLLFIHNRGPGAPAEFPAREVVDTGFLELVRYGIRRADDPLVVDSLAVVDAVLKVELPGGPCWRRYNHDGYGQRDDGAPYQGWGRGRPWPFLSGERGHYEVAAGRDPTPCLRAMENFATPTRLLAEQLWDGPDLPERLLRHGGPTGAAMPLMWAHAEYVKLLRSASDGRVFDLIDEVAERYRGARRPPPPPQVWKHNCRLRSVKAGSCVRIVADAPFLLHSSADQWRTAKDSRSTHTPLGIDYVDLATEPDGRAPLRFTFLWTDEERWEGQDYAIELAA
ncbi:MAG: glycoside hydrolase family 15 protein [Deltaproteobacteria bacterium]|nr:glycoside hydrolase family 15 protein [Deltaproteobacteria bacterium]